MERQQTNELLRVQTADYRSFVEELVQMGQIMSKKFYVVVPFDPLSNKKKSFFTRFNEVLKPAFTVRLKEEEVSKAQGGFGYAFAPSGERVEDGFAGHTIRYASAYRIVLLNI